MFSFVKNGFGKRRLNLLVQRNFFVLLSLLPLASSFAAPLNPNNILVAVNVSGRAPTGPFTQENSVVEFTPTGHVAQRIPFNFNGGPYPSGAEIVDIVVDRSGVIDAIDAYGTITGDTGYFTRYFPDTDTFSHQRLVDLGPDGPSDIATYKNFIFFTQGGIFRYDTSTNSHVVLSGHPGVMGLTIGLDGKLYATYRVQLSLNIYEARGIDVFDQETGAWLYTVELPAPLRRNAEINRLAVDASGRIFINDDRWTVFRLNRHGQVEASRMLVHYPDYLSDIALDENGRLIVSSGRGFIFVGDTTLTNFTSFHFPHDSHHDVSANSVTFAKYLPPATPAPIVTSTSSTLANISGRLRVQTGDRVGIGGFIVTGTGTKNVVLRGIGPSLAPNFGTGALQDPILELRDSSGALIASNDNWMTDPAHDEINSKGLAPANNLESALSQTLPVGSYTAILRGKNNGTGIGLIELYDVDTNTTATLANISMRGYVDRGDNVVIGGFIINGDPIDGEGGKVVVRGIGPSLTQSGITGALPDPTLELYNVFGWRLASNDNWRDTQAAAIQGAGLAPRNQRESAILATLSSGAYTAILRGKSNTTGVGLIEVYSIH
jgi:hypothetical protein